jgi:hypothetical protein
VTRPVQESGALSAGQSSGGLKQGFLSLRGWLHFNEMGSSGGLRTFWWPIARQTFGACISRAGFGFLAVTIQFNHE